MKTILVVVLLFILFYAALYCLLHYLTKPDLDPWIDSQPEPPCKPNGKPSDIVFCRECGGPKFDTAPCWSCNNQEDLKRISGSSQWR